MRAVSLAQTGGSTPDPRLWIPDLIKRLSCGCQICARESDLVSTAGRAFAGIWSVLRDQRLDWTVHSSVRSGIPSSHHKVMSAYIQRYSFADSIRVLKSDRRPGPVPSETRSSTRLNVSSSIVRPDGFLPCPEDQPTCSGRLASIFSSCSMSPAAKKARVQQI